MNSSSEEAQARSVVARVGSSLRTLGATNSFRLLVVGLALGVPVLNVAVVGYVYGMMRNVDAGRNLRDCFPGIAALPRHFWTGAKGIAGSFVVLFIPSFLFFLAWTAGWVLSYERILGLHLATGVFAALVSTIVIAPLLVYLQIAQVLFARTGQVRMFFRPTRILSLMRVSPWGNLAWACALPVLVVLHARMRWLFIEWPSTASYVGLNLAMFAAYACVRIGWTPRVARLEQRADSGDRPKVFAPWLAHGLLFVPAAVLTLMTAMRIFVASFGWTDFFLHPPFQIPTIPYAAGWYVPDTLP